MKESSYKERGRLGCVGWLLGGFAIITPLAIYLAVNDPPETAHQVTELSWPGGATSTLTYDRAGETARFKVDRPDITINLTCSAANIGSWSLEATIFDQRLSGEFDIASDQNTLSPCVKGAVNHKYDKAAAGHFIDLLEDAARSRVLGTLSSLIPLPNRPETS